MKIHYPLLFIILVITGISSCNKPKEETVTVESVMAEISEPVIPNKSLSILDFGAVANDSFNCKPAIDQALSTFNKQGGGKLVFPAGIYRINGPIHLISNMELHLDQGAILRFGSNPEDYLPVVKTSWEGTFLYNYSPFIYAFECQNLAITGQGTIDGEGSAIWSTWTSIQKEDQMRSRDMNHNNTAIESRVFGEGHYLRPQLIQFFNCKNIKVEGVQIEDSPFWCVHLLLCENVTIRGIKYEAFNKNNDGIDPEYSKNVLIEDVRFNNADDNVAIKAGRDDEGRASRIKSENIIIRNCHFQGLHALVIGSEMSAGVQNVFVNNCAFAGKLKRGIYLKSNPDRGGFIRNVYVKNVAFDEVEDCLYITSYYHNEGAGHATEISNIHFENITCNKATGTGIVIQGFTNKKVKNIYLTNIKIDSVTNGLSMENTENVILSDVIIGKPAPNPSAVH